jgi:hypothetical protein
MTTTKTQILDMLSAFIAQRPGMEPGNYGDWKSYRAESRSITRDRHDAEELLRAVRWRDSIGAEQLREAFRAFSGRLRLTETGDGRAQLDYCTGQYFPTEYRRAVCAVLAAALWDYTRTNMPPGSRQGASDGVELYPNPRGKGHVSAGDYIRGKLRAEFGPRLADRWFN